MTTEGMVNFDVGTNYGFSGVGLDNLGASEYTLVTILVDITGSVDGFERDLEAMLQAAIDACRKSPRSENLLVRVAYFQQYIGVAERHGFKALKDIGPGDYAGTIHPGGGTNLFDACYQGIMAMNAYAKTLYDSDYAVNGITFIITDGDDNASVASPRMVRDEARKSVTGEVLESHVSVLIGINAARYKQVLEHFQQEAELTQYIDAGEVNKNKLAKLAQFVSQSVSSQSLALGTGGPSQAIAATI